MADRCVRTLALTRIRTRTRTRTRSLILNPDPNTNPNPTLGEADYYANNFNDMASGFVVCFELLASPCPPRRRDAPPEPLALRPWP